VPPDGSVPIVARASRPCRAASPNSNERELAAPNTNMLIENLFASMSYVDPQKLLQTTRCLSRICFMSSFLDLDERIRLAIKIGESHYREFKSAWAGPSQKKVPRPLKEIAADIAQTLVAFANSDGGELIIGVEDDGAITGVPGSKDELIQLLQSTDTYVHKDTPLPSCLKTQVAIDGKTVLYFSVPKGTQFIHLTSEGRCLRRIDRDSIPVSAEHITAQRLEDQSRTWDTAAKNSPLKTLLTVWGL
jgi:hypothetical protein